MSLFQFECQTQSLISYGCGKRCVIEIESDRIKYPNRCPISGVPQDWEEIKGEECRKSE